MWGKKEVIDFSFRARRAEGPCGYSGGNVPVKLQLGARTTDLGVLTGLQKAAAAWEGLQSSHCGWVGSKTGDQNCWKCDTRGLTGKWGLQRGQPDTPGPWWHSMKWKGDIAAWTQSRLEERPSERARPQTVCSRSSPTHSPTHL